MRGPHRARQGTGVAPLAPARDGAEIPQMRMDRRLAFVLPLCLLPCLLLGLAAYFVLWPVPVDPVAWDAPADSGFTGPFALNTRLAGLTPIALGEHEGPEGVARDAQGRVYVSTRGGTILRFTADGADPVAWADTHGRPLGLVFDTAGTLFVADGERGLLAIDTLGAVRLLADSADGTRLEFTDDVAVADDGTVYFTDASTKFGLRAQSDENASTFDIIEHGAHGRLLAWDPHTGRATVLKDGLEFANGVAMTPDQRGVLVCETGAYRIVRIEVVGAERGRVTPVIENLPGFPDNISPGLDGRYWVALFAPRNALLDRLSAHPFLRKMILRIPSIVRPRAAEYGHVFAMDAQGKVLDDWQDPSGAFPKISDVLETERWLFIGSLQGGHLARVPR